MRYSRALATKLSYRVPGRIYGRSIAASGRKKLKRSTSYGLRSTTTGDFARPAPDARWEAFFSTTAVLDPRRSACAIRPDHLRRYHNTVVRAIITPSRGGLSKIWDGDRQPNCAVNLIELKNSRSELLIVGDTAHLEDVGSSGMLIGVIIDSCTPAQVGKPPQQASGLCTFAGRGYQIQVEGVHFSGGTTFSRIR